VLVNLIITSDYLNKHKSKNGGWKKSQFEAIDIRWPPSKGWKKSVIGRVITPSQQRKFERKGK